MAKKQLIKCNECQMSYEIDMDKVKENYIQCPNPMCMKISKNPFKKVKGGSE